MANRRIIGLMAAKSAGKTTASRVMENHGFKKLSIAEPIKDMCRVLGLTDEHLYGSLKEKPSDLLMGKTPRHVMQTLGADYAHSYIHRDIWLAITLRKISKTHGDVVIDDVRFPHEVDAIRALGGEIWVIRRPSVEPPITTWLQRMLAKIGIGKVPHVSELHWRDYVGTADQMLLNTETELEFEAAIWLRLMSRAIKRKAA
jgi:dephospho-CoA kinase